MSFYRTQMNNWLKQININTDRVLDIGGGAGAARDKVQSFKANVYHILDNGAEDAKAPVDFEDDINRSFHFYGRESDKRGEDRWYPHQFFDVVFCLEVMEYVYDPVTALQNMSDFLKPGGVLYITFPFVYPMHNPVGCDYLRYTEEGVRKLLEVAKFTKVEIMPRIIHNPDLLRAAYADDGMHYRKDDTYQHSGYCVTAWK